MRCEDWERDGQWGRDKWGPVNHGEDYDIGLASHGFYPSALPSPLKLSSTLAAFFALSVDSHTCPNMGWGQLLSHSLVKCPCMFVYGRITYKRIRGSHVLPVVPEVRGCLSVEGTLQETLCLLWSSQERTSGPSIPKIRVEESLSQRESAIPTKCFRPAQLIKSALWSTK